MKNDVKQPRFSFRKYSFGLCSVAIAMFCLGHGSMANANDATNGSSSSAVVSDKSSSSDTRTEVDTSKQTPVKGKVEVPFSLGGDTKTSVAPRQIVMVLDASTSMTEGTSRGGTSQDFAYNTAKTIINSLGDNDKATIVFAPVNNNINGIQTELTGDKATLLANLELYMQDPVSHRKGIPNVYGDQANAIGTATPTEEVLASQPGFDKNNAYVLWLTDDWTSEDWDKVDTSFFNWVKENTSKQLAVVNTYSNEHGEKALSTESFRSIGGNVAINPSPEEVLSQFNKLTVTEIKDGATVSIKGDDSLSYSNIKIVNSEGDTVKTIEDGSNINDNLGELAKGNYKLTFNYSGPFKEGHRDITATVHTNLENKDFSKVTPIDQANAVKTINTGRVVVSYKAGSKELAPSVTKFDNSDEGTAYDVSDLAKSELTVDGKKYVLTNSAKTKGKIQKGTTNVTFEYKLGTAPLVATFKSEEGVSLKEDLSKESNIDSNYDISSEVPTKLTKDGKSYTLIADSAKQQGTVSANGNHLDFVYKEDLGKLTVVSKSSEGATLDSYTVDNTHIGSDFDESSKAKTSIDTADGKHYVLDDSSLSNVKGKIDSLDKVVNLVYNESKGSVAVTYLDENGKEFQPKEDILSTASYGTSYDAKDKYLDKIVLPDGRTFIKSDKGTTLNGKVDKESTTIPLSYTESKGSVTIHYLDENGKEFQPKEDILSGVSYGTPYDVKDKYLDKIVLANGKVYVKATSDSKDTKATSDSKDVKDTKATSDSKDVKDTKATSESKDVKDAKATSDSKDVKDTKATSDSKDVKDVKDVKDTKATSDSKDVKDVKDVKDTKATSDAKDTKDSNALSGKVDKESIDINLNYKEVKTSLTLKFVSNGKEIQEMISLADKSVGEEYDLTSQVPDKITVKSVGSFKLVSKDLALKGKLTEEPISLEANYEPIMTKAKITFVDESGKEIAPSVNVDDVQLDSDYDFSKYAEKVITLSDGRQFELTATPENIKGSASEDVVTVKLVYREIVKTVVKTTNSTPVKEKTTQVSSPAHHENKALPNAGESSNRWYVALGASMLAIGIGAVAAMKKMSSSHKD